MRQERVVGRIVEGVMRSGEEGGLGAEVSGWEGEAEERMAWISSVSLWVEGVVALGEMVSVGGAGGGDLKGSGEVVF